MARFLFWLAFALTALAGPAAAQAVRTANVETELHAARAAVAPGERFTIVLRQTIRPGWHTYWRNPGDSGEATRLTWRLPGGAEAGPIQWPAPEALPFASLVNFGYSGEVLFPIEITAPANARVGETLRLEAEASWLVCSDVCIPESGALTLSLPVAAQGRDAPVWADRVAAALAALPKREDGVTAHISAGAPARLSVALPGAGEIRNARFFPYDRNAVKASAAQTPRRGEAGLSFSLTPLAEAELGAAALEGVIVYDARNGGAWQRRGVEIAAEPGPPLPDTDTRAIAFSNDYPLAELERDASGAAGAEPPLGLLAAAAFAFLGGLILNIMPCVLPVLSMKALSFAGGVHNGGARRHGVLYLAGVLATFLALAAVLIAMRGAGDAVGWGFQLQAPWVTSALALLFFAIGLNLLGVFSVGGALQGAGAGAAERGGDAGAFFTGALAVVAATPCTAPFMAGAIGAALTQSPAATFVIFAALGLGFALPLTALSFAPGLQRLIPKPGPWMERVRNVLAFPMFAAAIWLASVLTNQTGAAGLTALLALAAALAFALLVGQWGRVWLAIALGVLALTGAVAWRPLLGVETPSVLTAEPWSPARVAQARSEGKAVFVNFTADWCITCKANELSTLSQPAVARAFAEHNVVYLVADWTNRDDAIAAALAEHGRAGVPLYLYYPPQGAPVVLPQLLSQDFVISTVRRGAP